MSFVDARAFAKEGEVRHFFGEGRRSGRVLNRCFIVQ